MIQRLFAIHALKILQALKLNMRLHFGNKAYRYQVIVAVFNYILNNNIRSLDMSNDKAVLTVHENAPIVAIDYVAMAIEKGADLATIEKFMDLQERNNAYEAKKQFVTAMSAFKSVNLKINKDSKVSFGTTEYSHASLGNVTNVIGQELAKHGLSFNWKTKQHEGGLIEVMCSITHVMGHSETTSLQASPDQSGGKNNIQAVGSTVTYLERYTLLALTGCATSEQDSDAMPAVELITEDQANELYGLVSDNGIDQNNVNTWLNKVFKVSSFEGVSVSALPDVSRQLKAKIKKGAK